MNNKTILALISIVSMNTYANGLIIDMDSTDLDSFVPCDQITDEIRNSSEGYKCSYIKEGNRNVDSKTLNIFNNKINKDNFNFNERDPYPNIGINNVPTSLILNNKAGYVVYMSAEWDKYDSTTNSLVTYYQKTPHISVGYKASINMGSDVKLSRFTAFYKTIVKWYEIDYSYVLGPFRSDNSNVRGAHGVSFVQNEWVTSDGSEQLVQLDFWGTYFSPRWKLVQPAGTVHVTSFQNWYEHTLN